MLIKIWYMRPSWLVRLLMFQKSLLPPSSGSMQSKTSNFSWNASSSAMSVIIHQSTWCHTPRDLNLLKCSASISPMLYKTPDTTSWNSWQSASSLCVQDGISSQIMKLSSAWVSLSASQIERRTSITGQIPANTEFTNVIMKFQKKY